MNFQKIKNLSIFTRMEARIFYKSWEIKRTLLFSADFEPDWCLGLSGLRDLEWSLLGILLISVKLEKILLSNRKIEEEKLEVKSLKNTLFL